MGYVIKATMPKARNPEKEYSTTATNQQLMKDHSKMTYPMVKATFLTATEKSNQKLGFEALMPKA